MNTEHSPVGLCRANDLALFAKVDICCQRSEFVGPPGLYLDKTKDVAIEGDDIDLSGHLHALAVAADWHFEIRKDEPIAVRDKKTRGQEFAAVTEAEPGRYLRLRYRKDIFQV